MKKYYSFALIILSVCLLVGVLRFEKKDKNINLNKEEKLEDTTSIEDKVFPKTKLILKEDVTIKRGSCCTWLIKEDVACGIYTKKGLFSKTLEKGDELNVEWVTNKRFLLPCLTFSIEDQDTIIYAKTNSGLDVYIDIIKGKDLEIVEKRNKYSYQGSIIEPATLNNLQLFFDVESIEKQN
jgi:hypothetical protein